MKAIALLRPSLPILIAFLGALPLRSEATKDWSTVPARPSPAWIREAVVYEIFPRQFSPKGDFAGITARLDELKSLGVDVLWLMPIHPIGRLKAKGSIGSPYAVQDFYAVNPDYGTKEDFRRLVERSEEHTSELQSPCNLVCRLLIEQKNHSDRRIALSLARDSDADSGRR